MRDNALATAVIVVAAGSGQRLGKGIPKARVQLGAEPMLVHALRGVLAAGVAGRIVVCIPSGDEVMRRLCHRPDTDVQPRVTVVDGGRSRSESVRNALDALDSGTTRVLIHDAARPLAPPEVFHRVAAALASGAKAVIPAIAVADTIKAVVAAAPGAPSAVVVEHTPDRATLRAVQTPQGFDVQALRAAHAAAEGTDAGVTDDAMLMEAQGVDVFVVPGSELSHKITTVTDLLLAEALLAGPLAPRWVEG